MQSTAGFHEAMMAWIGVDFWIACSLQDPSLTISQDWSQMRHKSREEQSSSVVEDAGTSCAILMESYM